MEEWGERFFSQTSSLVLSLKQHLFLSRIKKSKKVNWLQFLCVIGIIGR